MSASGSGTSGESVHLPTITLGRAAGASLAFTGDDRRVLVRGRDHGRRAVIDDALRRTWRADTLGDQLDHLEIHLSATGTGGDTVTYSHSLGCLRRCPVHPDLPRSARIGGRGPGPVDADSPEPHVDANSPGRHLSIMAGTERAAT